MAQDQDKSSGPDLAQGVASGGLVDGGKLVGHAGNEQVLLVVASIFRGVESLQAEVTMERDAARAHPGQAV